MSADEAAWWIHVITILVVVHHVAGVALAVHALWQVRSSQATIAWIMALVLWPSLTVYLYLMVGMRRMARYTDARRVGDKAIHQLGARLGEQAAASGFIPLDGDPDTLLLGRLSRMPPLGGNRTELLIDGVATFDSILLGIRAARQQIVLQFFIIRDDGLGRRLADALCERATAGVACWLLYDGIGSHALSRRWIARLVAAGVQIAAFNNRRGLFHRFRINFRNHRKIVVVDGARAWVGGLNVGDEYLGEDPDIGPWRDTHLAIHGPAALACQLSFVEDWYWITGTVPDLAWTPRSAGQEQVLVVPTGPGDPVDSAVLLLLQAITKAQHRLWITSPYFVPDEVIASALQLAALRGVDVRILLPGQRDKLLPHLAAQTYLADLGPSGIHFHAWPGGFMHQKVVLVDERWAFIGTANLDNRSLHINFEITVVLDESAAVQEVAAMLERDLERSPELDARAFLDRPFVVRVAARLARLFSPLL